MLSVIGSARVMFKLVILNLKTIEELILSNHKLKILAKDSLLYSTLIHRSMARLEPIVTEYCGTLVTSTYV